MDIVTKITVTFLIVHILICVLIAILFKTRVFKMSEQLFTIIVVVPVWGIILGIFAEIITRQQKTGSKRIMLEKLTIKDYRIININSDEDEGTIVPLEEAMAINDSQSRRKLMIEILHQDPNQYVRLLQQARLNDDIEITHYASTAMMELQREHELLLQQYEKELAKNPDDIDKLNSCIDAYKKYIESGLLEQNILKIQRNRYAELLLMKYNIMPKEKSVIFDLADNYIEMGDYTNANNQIERIIYRWPDDENSWFIKLKYCYETNNGKELNSVIKKIEDNNVYLSSIGKETMRFWKQTAQENF